MGLMDKVKAQATQLAQKTQETARDSKVKFDQAQAKRRADAMLRNLGALVYAEHTGRGTADSQAQTDKLIADIAAHEAENGISLAAETTDHRAPQADGSSAAESPTGFPPAGPPSSGAAGATGFPPSGPPSSGATGFPPDAGSTQF